MDKLLGERFITKKLPHYHAPKAICLEPFVESSLSTEMPTDEGD